MKTRVFSFFFHLALVVAITLTWMSLLSAENRDRAQSAELPKPTLAPLNPDFVDYLNHPEKYSIPSADGLEPLVPFPVDLTHLRGRRVFKGEQTLTFPSRFDLREEGKLSPVKDQGTCGACWAFATAGCLESLFLPYENWDFSENNIKNTHGFDMTPCQGGFPYMAMAYLTRWSGPVYESQDPYNPNSGYSPPGLLPQKHTQDIIIIPYVPDYSNLKQAIMQYGGVFSGMYWNSYYYRAATYAYYNPSSQSDNHAIVIVGWDDNYSRYNFSTTAPGDGAFIVRNSWGTGFGDGGYFYISYYDQNIGLSCGIPTKVEPVSNFSRVYQYDWLGWTAVLGYGNVGYNNETAWCANVFTATVSEKLSAVSFYSSGLDTNYDIFIYLNASSGPRSGTQAAYTNGIIPIPGYHTIYLPELVQLQAGQKFSVVLKIRTPGYSFPVPVERPVQSYSSLATANPGESFVSPDGTNWTDLTSSFPNTNVCLKAFTTTSQPTLYATHVASDTTWWTRLSLLNTGSVSTSIQLLAINQNGQVLETKTISNLSPSNSYSADVSQLFSGSTLSQGLWVKILHNSEVKGVLEFGTRDNLSHATIPLLESGDNEILYPYVVHTADWYTGITIVNPQTTPAGVTIEAFNESGTLLGDAVTTIPSQGKYVRLLPYIFNGIDPLSIRFLRVRSNQAILGFELFGSFVNTGLAGMPAMSPNKIFSKEELGESQLVAPPSSPTQDLAQADTYSLIYNAIPYIGYFFTGVTFSNLDSQPTTIHNDLYLYDGTRLVQYYWPESVDPLEQVTREVWTACGMGGSNENASYLMASSPSPLMGFELFFYDTGDPNSFLLDGIGCATSGGTITYMPTVKGGSDWDIDVFYVTNVSDMVNNFTVYFYQSNGTLLGTYAGSIPARGQSSGWISGVDNPNVAWVKIQATYSIITSILYISSDWKRMGAYLGME